MVHHDKWCLLVLQAVYGTLSEAEHRSTFYIPYWKFPLSRWLVPRQRKFHEDLKVINDCLDDLIKRAQATRQVRAVDRSLCLTLLCCRISSYIVSAFIHAIKIGKLSRL